MRRVELAVIGSDGGLDPPVGARLVTALPCVIGRSPPCDVILAGDQVARRHARLAWEGGRVVIADLASEAGVVIDGVLGRGGAGVGDGAVVGIGNFTLRITILGAADD